MNNTFSFDSMCYDILFDKRGKFAITEMSYGYIDRALHKAKGYFELFANSDLVFRERHTWPQELWVEWALRRAENQRRADHKVPCRDS